MKIWKLNNKNKFECIKTITFQNSETSCNILRLNENEFVTSSSGDKCLKFWNSNDYSNIATLNNIETDYGFKRMCLLEDDLLCVGGTDSKGFYLIKISTHQLIKNILGPKYIYSIIECLDGLFLCSIYDENGNHSLIKYKYEEQNLKKIVEKVKAHDNHIYSCVELNDGTIASGGDDTLIKLWCD
jgi:WD40 repeat protein